MLKERLPEVFVHLHRIPEQRVGFSGLYHWKTRRRDCEDHPEHQSGCRRWQELNQESLCYHADNRSYPNWRYRLGTAAPPFNRLVHPKTRRKPTRLTS